MKGSHALFLSLSLLLLSGCDLFSTAQETKKQKSSPPHRVEVSSIKNIPLSHSTERTGTLIARGRVKIFNQEEGRIDYLRAYEGDSVAAGDLLIRLDDRLLRSQLAKAVAIRKKAESDQKRTKVLQQKNISSLEKRMQVETDLKIAQAEEAIIQTRVGYTQIHAPFTGVITKRWVDPGDIAPRHTHLLTLIDPKSLYTEITVSELLLPHFKVGDAAQVRIDALGRGFFPGKIVRIHPTIDNRTRQGVVEVQLVEIPQGTAAGQLCRVTLNTPIVNRQVVLFAALQSGREGEYVYVVEDGVARQRNIVTGLRFGHSVEILKGVVEGALVVIRGFLGLTEGKKVLVVGQEGQGKPP